ESKRGRHSQSIEPSRWTSAALRALPIKAQSSIRRSMDAGLRGRAFAGSAEARRLRGTRSRAFHVELDLDVAARRVRIGTDLFVRVLRQCRKLRLGQALVLHVELDGETESARIARPDRNRAGDDCAFRILLLLLGDVIE